MVSSVAVTKRSLIKTEDDLGVEVAEIRPVGVRIAPLFKLIL